MNFDKIKQNVHVPKQTPLTSSFDKKSQKAPMFDEILDISKSVFDGENSEYDIMPITVNYNLCDSGSSSSFTLDKSGEKISGKVVHKTKCDKFDIKVTTKNDLNTVVSIGSSSLIPNGNVLLEARTNNTGKVEAKYQNKVVASSLKLFNTGTRSVMLSPSLSLFYKKFCVSANVEALLSGNSPLKNRLTDYNFAMAFYKDQHKFGLYTSDKLSRLHAQVLFQLCPKTKLGLSAVAATTNNQKGVAADIGAVTKYSDNLTIHGKFDTAGQLSSVFTQRITPNFAVSVLSRFSPFDKNCPARFGTKLSFSSQMSECVESCH